MSLYQVRFIKEVTDADEAHVVVDVDAPNHDEALRRARATKTNELWLANYGFYSVEVKRC
jgi:hypothetical protein